MGPEKPEPRNYPGQVGPPIKQEMPLPGGSFRYRLHHGAAWALASHGAAILAQAGIIVLLAKLGSASVVGEYALALAIVAPIALLARLQLRAVIATDVVKEQRFGVYVALRLLTNLVTIGSVALVVSGLRYEAEFTYVVLAFALVKTIENTSDVFLGRLQANEDWRRIAISSFTKAGCSLAAFLTVWMWGAGLAPSILAFGAGHLVVLGCYELPAVRALLRPENETVWPIWNGALLSRLTKTSLPLGFVAMFVSLILQAPRYFVEAYEGTEALGYWSAVVQLATVPSLLLQPLGQASLSRLAWYDRGDEAAYRRLLGILIAAAVLIGIVGIAGTFALGEWALRVIYRPEYETLQPVLVVLMIGMSATHVAAILGFVLTAARRFRLQLVLFALTAVASAASCRLLLPEYGLLGAAYAHAATWLFACIGGSASLIWHRRQHTGESSAVVKPDLPYVADNNPLA
jgi:O-antigen/teichoic acid export membrane protein